MNRRGSNASRLEEWRKIISAKRQQELEEVKAGLDAEVALRSMAKDHLTWKTASIFHSKRVPKDPLFATKGRYEIDLIMVSPKQICAIEIKNWSGRLRIDENQWVQERSSGEQVSHDNALAKNKEKLDCLCAMLEARNIRVPSTRLCRVIFWNPNLNIPSKVAEREEIVMRHELDRFLSNQEATGLAEKFLISVLELCLDQESSAIATDGFFKAVPSGDYSAAVNTISSLETFDKIELFGGRVISGDLIELRAGRDRLSLKSISSGSEVKVICSRNKVMLFLSAVLGSSPIISMSQPLDKLSINSDDKIYFHRVGNQKPEEIEIRQIIRMIRG